MKLSAVAVALLGCASSLLSGAALADPKTCISAHATGQREAKVGHLRLATQLFTTCGSDETCPSQLRQECAEFLRYVQQTIPTVIFAAIGEKGEDISTVKVFSTEELIVDGLDGRAIQIDPGKHHLRFLLPTGEILESDVLIREGERNRIIRVRVAEKVDGDVAPTNKLAPMPPPPVVAPLASSPEKRTLPFAFWIASGAAVAGLGVGATYAVLGKTQRNNLSDCAPYCGEHMRNTYDNLKRDYLIADVGFAVSIVSAGVATWLFVSSHYGKAERLSTSGFEQRTMTRLVPTCAATNDGGTLTWSGRF